MFQRTLLFLGGLLLAVSSTRADSPLTAATAARNTWAITDTVLDKHIDPPSRQEMLLYGLRGFYHRAQKSPPTDLARRASSITTEAELSKLLGEAWPAKADETKAQELGEALLRGVLLPVHGHPHLYSARQYRAVEQVTNNRYEGTGIQVRMHAEEKLVQVMNTFPGGPARRAGMLANDLIEVVDDVATKGKTLQQVVELIQGSAGIPISIVVRQPGSTEKRTLKMVRDVVPFETVTGVRRTGETTWSYRIEPSEPIAVLRIRSFTSSAVSELRRIEKRLQEDGCRALILDLRFANGGDAHQATLVADTLLDGGTMWRVRDRQGQIRDYKADRDCLFRDWPMAVLVNEHTRGTGGDLVAMALQDAGRATIVGEPTRGDGLVKGFHEVGHGLGMLHVATGEVIRVPTGHTPKVPLEPREATAPRLLAVHPHQVVKATGLQATTIEDWQRQQETGVAPEKSGPRPQDDPMAKALEILKKAMKEQATP